MSVSRRSQQDRMYVTTGITHPRLNKWTMRSSTVFLSSSCGQNRETSNERLAKKDKKTRYFAAVHCAGRGVTSVGGGVISQTGVTSWWVIGWGGGYKAKVSWSLNHSLLQYYLVPFSKAVKWQLIAFVGIQNHFVWKNRNGKSFYLHQHIKVVKRRLEQANVQI